MILLDANVILRALTVSDDPRVRVMNRQAVALFQQVAAGDADVTILDAIVAEVAFVLTSRAHHNVETADAASRIAALLRIPHVRMHNKDLILAALSLWASRPQLGFVDALLASYAQRPGMELATFDQHFDPIPDITRWHPDSEEFDGLSDTGPNTNGTL